MARRDNQGIQIAMIVFILLTLVFLVTTYFGWSSSNRLAAANDSLQSELDTANQGIRGAETLVETVKQYAGVEGDAAEELRVAVQETYGQGLPEENQNCIDIMNSMVSRIHELNGELKTLRERERTLMAELEAKEQQRAEGIAAAEAGWQKAQSEQQQLQAAFQADRSSLEQQREQFRVAKNDAEQSAEQAKQNADERVAEANKQLNLTNSILAERQAEINRMRVDTPDRYDGSVVGVLQATRNVWLNVGRADGVRTKTIFGVYDADENNVASAERKASVEVIRVLDDHSSLARVTDDTYLTPIVKGDHIYSPIWDPGKRLGIALVGVMDIDGDNKDDRDYIRNLINLNGGQVDAEDVDGEVKGTITVDTRYLVKGESPVEDSTRSTMINDAERLSVEQLSLTELLDLMGFQGRARSLSYRGVVRPGDFAPEPRDGAQRRNAPDFRERAPLRRRSQPSPSYR